ncbi:hypothetical protein [Bradyrhizobium canariense]|uniref:hypothetical protein n=1 Tax=Bradyrhizobium canariense TaxID=255045 RepID=UPI003D9BA9F5
MSKTDAPIAVRAGAVVVDNSSAFRMDPNLPLVILEINAAASATARASSHQKNRIKRVISAT